MRLLFLNPHFDISGKNHIFDIVLHIINLIKKTHFDISGRKKNKSYLLLLLLLLLSF